MEENDFVSIWLEETGNPAIEELTHLNQEIAAKTTKVLTAKGLTETELAIMLDINLDEVKRWLAGRHPFSLKILKQIADTL